LKLITTTPLPGHTGDLDHFGLDLKGGRLFLAAEDQKTVEMFDLRSGARIHSISGFGHPLAMAYLAPSDQLVVTDGESGMDSALTRRSILREIGGHSRDRHTDSYLHPNWLEKLAAIDRLPSPANFTTPVPAEQQLATVGTDETTEMEGFRMVGPCGLEPQTSTVSR
jgi:hypothetical protein